MPTLNFGTVVDDALIYIFSYLKPPEILSMRMVSKLEIAEFL